jgi:hypothetical protein
VRALYVRSGLLQLDAGKQRFGNFTELNVWLGQRCRALWDEVRHSEYMQFSMAEILEHEQPI